MIHSKSISKIFLFLPLLFILMGIVSLGYAESSDKEADSSLSGPSIYFFWGEGCPHCRDEKIFLKKLQDDYPAIKIKEFETWHRPENARLYMNMAASFGIKPTGVPATFIGNKAWIGFADFIAEEIEQQTVKCINNGCIDAASKLSVSKGNADVSKHKESLSPLRPICVHVFMKEDCPQCRNITQYLDEIKSGLNVELTKHYISDPKNAELYAHFKKTYGIEYAGFPTAFIGNRYLIGTKAIRNNLESEIINCGKTGCECPLKNEQTFSPYPPKPADITPEEGSSVSIPIVGSMDAKDLSLPVFTALLGGLDSFNPCAFFVLFVLLGMLIHAKSRLRMSIIGGTFVIISGLIYFLFMAAWLNLFLIVGHLTIITVIAGIVALAVAVLNIKDYFFFRKGVSLSIPEKAKPKLFQRMRGLLKASSMTSMLIGTVVLAIAANSYELLCTAGFPMVFTRILTLHNLSTYEHYMYLALYNFVYVIPLLLIVAVFVATLGGRKLSEEQGQTLKLISGLMMLGLGLVLLVSPSLLNNVSFSAGLLLGVLIATFLIRLINNRVKSKSLKSA